MGQREFRTLGPLHVSVYVRLFMLNMGVSMKACVRQKEARCSWFDCTLYDSYLSVDMTKSLILCVYGEWAD